MSVSAFRVYEPPAPSISAVDHLPLVRSIAVRIARRLPQHVALEDLISAGTVGLMEAIERYDPQRAAKFEAFARLRIQGAIYDELRQRDLMARDARTEAKRIQNAMHGLRQTLGREPEDDELALELGLESSELNKKMEQLTPIQVMSVEDVTGDLAAPSGSPFELSAKRELVSKLVEGLTQLKERHREVLYLYYQEGLRLREIGEVLGVTESRASQLLTAATLALRERIETAMQPRNLRHE